MDDYVDFDLETQAFLAQLMQKGETPTPDLGCNVVIRRDTDVLIGPLEDQGPTATPASLHDFLNPHTSGRAVGQIPALVSYHSALGGKRINPDLQHAKEYAHFEGTHSLFNGVDGSDIWKPLTSTSNTHTTGPNCGTNFLSMNSPRLLSDQFPHVPALQQQNGHSKHHALCLYPTLQTATCSRVGSSGQDTHADAVESDITHCVGVENFTSPTEMASKGETIAESGAKLKCEYPGCTSRKRFQRKYELRRHMAKHSKSAAVFECPALECDRKGSKAFYRRDKLIDHLKVHVEKSTFMCPIKGCDHGPIVMILLLEHLSRHLPLCTEQGEKDPLTRTRLLRGWNRPCPLEGCRKILGAPAALQEHLLRHSEQERKSQKIAMFTAGYDPSTVRVICPCCGLKQEQHGQFEEHLYEKHVQIDWTHVSSWVDELKKGGFSIESIPNSRPRVNVEASSPLAWFAVNVPRQKTVSCQCCGYRVVNQRYRKQMIPFLSHKALFNQTDELYQHREAILRLSPRFGAHPIFDDIQPTVNVKDESVYWFDVALVPRVIKNQSNGNGSIDIA